MYLQVEYNSCCTRPSIPSFLYRCPSPVSPVITILIIVVAVWFLFTQEPGRNRRIYPKRLRWPVVSLSGYMVYSIDTGHIIYTYNVAVRVPWVVDQTMVFYNNKMASRCSYKTHSHNPPITGSRYYHKVLLFGSFMATAGPTLNWSEDVASIFVKWVLSSQGGTDTVAHTLVLWVVELQAKNLVRR